MGLGHNVTRAPDIGMVVKANTLVSSVWSRLETCSSFRFSNDEHVQNHSIFEKMKFEFALNNSVNPLIGLSSSMFNICSFKAKNTVLEFERQQMNMFESLQCSNNDVRIHLMFDKTLFDSSLLLVRFFICYLVILYFCRKNLGDTHK